MHQIFIIIISSLLVGVAGATAQTRYCFSDKECAKKNPDLPYCSQNHGGPVSPKDPYRCVDKYTQALHSLHSPSQTTNPTLNEIPCPEGSILVDGNRVCKNCDTTIIPLTQIIESKKNPFINPNISCFFTIVNQLNSKMQALYNKAYMTCKKDKIICAQNILGENLKFQECVDSYQGTTANIFNAFLNFITHKRM